MFSATGVLGVFPEALNSAGGEALDGDICITLRSNSASCNRSLRVLIVELPVMLVFKYLLYHFKFSTSAADNFSLFPLVPITPLKSSIILASWSDDIGSTGKLATSAAGVDDGDGAGAVTFGPSDGVAFTRAVKAFAFCVFFKCVWANSSLASSAVSAAGAGAVAFILVLLNSHL